MRTGEITADARNVLPLLRDRLYPVREVFLRELVSNACDALARMSVVARGMPNCGDQVYRIDISTDPGASAIAVEDNGIGMTSEDVDNYINRIAASGTADFAKHYEADGGLIGAFGIGFYSAFLVASHIKLETKSYIADEPACCWESDGDVGFTMDAGERTARGTKITLVLSDENREFLDSERVAAIVRKYSDFVPFPIYLNNQLANSVQAPWHQPRASLTPRIYTEFYDRLFPGANAPRFWVHMETDVPVVLRGIVYAPHAPDREGSIRLFCNRVFVDEDFTEVVPEYLRFLRGVLDVDGLPLDLSRERVQSHPVVRGIRSFITRKIAEEFVKIAETRREDYTDLWPAYEELLKIGCIRDDYWFERLHPWLLFRSSRGGYATLREYLQRAGDDTAGVVYYLTDEHRHKAYLQAYQERNAEVLYFSGRLDLLVLNRIRVLCPNLAEFRRIDTDGQTLVADGDVPETGEANQMAFAHFFSMFCGGAEVKVKTLKSASIPVLIQKRHRNAQEADIEDLRRQFRDDQSTTGETKASVILNKRHPLIMSVMRVHQRNRQDVLLARICDVMYRHAAVRFNLADEVAKGEFLSRTEQLLCEVCQELERTTTTQEHAEKESH